MVSIKEQFPGSVGTSTAIDPLTLFVLYTGDRVYSRLTSSMTPPDGSKNRV